MPDLPTLHLTSEELQKMREALNPKAKMGFAFRNNHDIVAWFKEATRDLGRHVDVSIDVPLEYVPIIEDVLGVKLLPE